MHKSFKDLARATLSRHGIGRQVTAGLMVQQLNSLLYELDPSLKNKIKILSYQFGIVKIGLTHMAHKERFALHEVALRHLAQSFVEKDIRFTYVLISEASMI